MYAGTSGSTHGDRKLSRPAPIATAIDRSPFIPGSRPFPRSGFWSNRHRAIERVSEHPANLAGGHEQLQASPVELDHGNSLEVLAVPVGIGLDVALDDAWNRQAASGSVLERALDRVARLVTEVAAR